MRCVVVPINRSDFVFESSFSSIVRSYEIFRPHKLVILYANFNKVHLQRLSDLLSELRKKGVNVVTKEIHDQSFDEFKGMIKEEVKGCEKVYLVPTSGANIIAVYLALLHAQEKYPLVNFIFRFGPWTSFYYPFVPRSMEKVMVLGDSTPTNVKLDLNLDGYLSDTLFTKTVQAMAIKLNKALDKEGEEDLVLKINEEPVLSTASSSYRDVKNILSELTAKDSSLISTEKYRDPSKTILSLAGAYEIEVDLRGELHESRQKEEDKGSPTGSNAPPHISTVEEVSYGRNVIIDTNLVYFGIHTHEVRNLVIPYCVHNEVLWNVNTKTKFSNAVFYVYEALRERARMIPSESTICDVAIPKIEPDLIKGSVILTGDNFTFNRWKKLAVNSYTDIFRVRVGEKERSGKVNVSAVIFNLAAILGLMGVEGVEVCWKGGTCVSPHERDPTAKNSKNTV
ncbi:hypothetical protein [Stygiolobus caldivivus]|uniref:Uncharacterized protein n=1 Tax=Stygiolobus caldivivus TaxID=2824673 RepID=A0A8D5U655_9CREN|nr:hypothetical protein [Stygiolobus caldivivus]BCU69972.1 hypothetical protein KN1_12690 [Stygiolobus caldivivus]